MGIAGDLPGARRGRLQVALRVLAYTVDGFGHTIQKPVAKTRRLRLIPVRSLLDSAVAVRVRRTAVNVGKRV